MAPYSSKRLNKKNSKSVTFAPDDNYATSSENSQPNTTSEDPAVPKLTPPISSAGIHYENRMLYYLTKLRNYLYASEVSSQSPKSIASGVSIKERLAVDNPSDDKKSVIEKANKIHCDRYSSKSQPQSDTHSVKKYKTKTFKKPGPLRKAENIVSATIDYGLANGIILKSGKYFWFSTGNKLSPKARTPDVNLDQPSTSHNCNTDAVAPKSDKSDYKKNSGVKINKLSEYQVPVQNNLTHHTNSKFSSSFKTNKYKSNYGKVYDVPNRNTSKNAKPSKAKKHKRRYQYSTTSSDSNSRLPSRKRCKCDVCKKKRQRIRKRSGKFT